MTHKKKKLVLASASPRRRDLLKYHFDLKIFPKDIDETPFRGEAPRNYVQRVARAKWFAAAKELNRSEILLSADTTVSLGRKILGKPSSASDCRRMMTLLSGKTHDVLSAVCVGWARAKSPTCFVVKSTIKFRRISHWEVTRYVKAGDWQGKAGAYAIQGQGADFVEFFKGPFTNIVGLPVIQTFRVLEKTFSRSTR